MVAIDEYLPAQLQQYSLMIEYGVLCLLVYLSFRTLSSTMIPGYDKLKPHLKLDWWNRGTAMMHAALMFYIAARYWLFVNPTMTITTTIGEYEKAALDMMTGYMIYDTIIELFFVSRLDGLVIFHHVLGLLSHGYSFYLNSGMSAFYLMMVYLAESSTPFLHLGWLLHHLKQDKTIVFKACSGLILVLFFFFRIVLGPYLLFHMVAYRELWVNQFYLLVTQEVIVVGFVLLNYYWFYKLCRMAVSPKARDVEKLHIE